MVRLLKHEQVVKVEFSPKAILIYTSTVHKALNKPEEGSRGEKAKVYARKGQGSLLLIFHYFNSLRLVSH